MSKPIAFKKMRDNATTENNPKNNIEKSFINAIDQPVNEEILQSPKKNGKVTTVVLDEEATSILEKLKVLEDRSERKITSRLLNSALKETWKQFNSEKAL